MRLSTDRFPRAQWFARNLARATCKNTGKDGQLRLREEHARFIFKL